MRDPAGGAFLDQVARIEQRRVGLLADLQRVAAVDEHRGLADQRDRRAGRAGEGGEPGEALVALGHIFALMRIGARHEEAVETAALQLGAQMAKARRAGRCVGFVLIGLEGAGLVHGSRL